MIKRLIKKILPNVWIRHYVSLKNKNKSAEAIFTEIYKKGYWGKTEGVAYFSGTGTHDENTIKYIDILVNFINKNNIQSVFEIGCGDFSITKKVLHQVDINYTGADIVANLIVHLEKNYGNKKNNFIHIDAIEAKNYPNADLCIIRQVLQHLSNDQILQILQKTKKFKYVIITEHIPAHPEEINGDKNLGGYIRLQNAKKSGVFLDKAPFSQNCDIILSYQKNDEDRNGRIVPALMVTSLIKNNLAIS